MSDVSDNEKVVWTPRMPDRRKTDRRDGQQDFQTNGKSLNISNMRKLSDRRSRPDRRNNVSVTITGRAIDIEEGRP